MTDEKVTKKRGDEKPKEILTVEKRWNKLISSLTEEDIDMFIKIVKGQLNEELSPEEEEQLQLIKKDAFVKSILLIGLWIEFALKDGRKADDLQNAQKVLKWIKYVEKELLKRKTFPRLEPMEINFVEMPIWYPSRKGSFKQNPEIKTKCLKKGKVTIEYDYELSLPTVFTFRVFNVLWGIWREQGCLDTFWTSLGGICRRMGIPTDKNNRRLVLIALRQLRNIRISAPFWVVDEGSEKRNVGIYRINLIDIVTERFEPGRECTIELAFNRNIQENVRRNHFLILDQKIFNKLKSPTAQRLYSIIEQIKPKKNNPYQRKLAVLVEILNLKGTHTKQTVKKASEELVRIGYLQSFKIDKGKGSGELVYRAWIKEKKSKGE